MLEAGNVGSCCQVIVMIKAPIKVYEGLQVLYHAQQEDLGGADV